ncbi:MAG TPA: hypothetical protein VHL57_03450 [Flavobacteriales bacterium]|jgi:hypothetical protein|nr:hypothetical protein [Flavobacteriales bacterium]
MANEGLSTSGSSGLRKRLDEAVVLHGTVGQLQKDLNAELDLPEVGEGAFEALRGQVLRVLEERQGRGAHAFGLVLNRVDLTEGAFSQAMAAGGLDELAARIVLRCLQKVLARERFAGRG